MEKIILCEGNQRKDRVAILMSVLLLSFKTKTVIRDKVACYIMLNGSIQQENMTFVNIYAPNIRAHKYIKLIFIELKKKVDSNSMVVKEFNTPLTSMDRSSDRKSIWKHKPQ